MESVVSTREIQLLLERKSLYGITIGSLVVKGSKNQYWILVPQTSFVKDLQDLRKNWDEGKIRNNPQDIEDILKIHIAQNKAVDKRIWPYLNSGQLSNKSAYRTHIKNR